jgi:hypothetical protein
MRKKKCLTTLTFQIYNPVYETGNTINEKHMKLNPQQIKYQRMETGKQKSITQKDLKIIIIKRIKVKIEKKIN